MRWLENLKSKSLILKRKKLNFFYFISNFYVYISSRRFAKEVMLNIFPKMFVLFYSLKTRLEFVEINKKIINFILHIFL